MLRSGFLQFSSRNGASLVRNSHSRNYKDLDHLADPIKKPTDFSVCRLFFCEKVTFVHGCQPQNRTIEHSQNRLASLKGIQKKSKPSKEGASCEYI